MHSLKKYLKLYGAFFKASFIADTEYRFNFLARIVTDIFWYLAQIITFETIYHHTDNIGGWKVEQMRVFLGIVFIVDAIFMIIFEDNLHRMGEKVRKGELDLLLAKPVNAQFMLSCQRVNTAIFGNLIISLAWLVWSLGNLPNFEPVKLFWLLFLLPIGVMCVYAFRFFFASTSLILTRAENLQYLWYQLYKVALRPDSVYVPWVRYMIFTLFPVAFVASVPARFLMENPPLYLAVWAFALILALNIAVSKFWNYALKKYSSASS